MKKQEINLTKFELEIMEVFWKIGEASVREVQEALHERKRPAYTTVHTIVTRLEEKNALERTRKIGNAFLFKPLVTRKAAFRRIIDDFLQLFGGSAQPVIAQMLETGHLTLEDLKAVEQEHQEDPSVAERPGKRRK